MNTEPAQLELRPGHSRVRSVWVEPSSAGVEGHPVASGEAVPASAGRWEQRAHAQHARRTVGVPVVVGSELRIF